jgi:hypothetical protein
LPPSSGRRRYSPEDSHLHLNGDYEGGADLSLNREERYKKKQEETTEKVNKREKNKYKGKKDYKRKK